jgi:hypothetical protein
MKRALNEATVKKIFKTLVERFGEPISQAVEIGPDEQVKSVEPEVKRVRACPICRGRGKVDSHKNNGMRTTRMKCPGCNGRGFMDVKPPEPTTESVNECKHCGNIPRQLSEGMCCDQCGMMQSMEEAEASGRHPGHATGCTCPDCSRPEVEDGVDPDEQKDAENRLSAAWASFDKKF